MKKEPRPAGGTTAFLLAQLGAQAAMKFAERLAALDLSPPHAGILRVIQASAGVSQQTLSEALGILPSRLVALVDELEDRGIVERRDSPDDRRIYALFLTRKGAETMEAIGKVARAHDEALCSPLDDDERETLASLLRKLAAHQGLTPGVHPGFQRLGRPPRAARKKRPSD